MPSQDAVTPDSKDWTWVLTDPCPDCGFDAAAVDVASAGSQVRSLASDMAIALRNGSVAVRPRASVWSALEYGCHVRDVFDRFDRRFQLMLREDNPLMENWDQDATAIEEQYGSQSPETVIEELQVAAEAVASTIDSFTTDQLPRPGRRSDGAQFTVETFLRYFLHDPTHHLVDIQRGYDTLDGNR